MSTVGITIPEIAGTLAKARQVAAGMPRGDETRRALEFACDSIVKALGFRFTPGSPEAAERIADLRVLLEKLGRMFDMLDHMELHDRFARASEEVGKAQRKGGEERAKLQAKDAADNQARVERAAEELRANGTKERNLAAKIALRFAAEPAGTRLSVKQISRILAKLRSAS